MKIKFITSLTGCLLCLSLFSQTIKEKIDKQAKDKTTMDKAAKADVLIQKKTITDSSVRHHYTIPEPKKNSDPAIKKVKYKKHKYKKKIKPSSK